MAPHIGIQELVIIGLLGMMALGAIAVVITVAVILSRRNRGEGP